MSLRNCQTKAIYFFNKNYVENKNFTNISMCTGSGKSRVIQEITKQSNKRIIIVFPWLALIKQFWDDKLNPHRSHNFVRYYATVYLNRKNHNYKKIDLKKTFYLLL